MHFKTSIRIKKDRLYCICLGMLGFIYCLKNAYVISTNNDLYNLIDNTEYIFYVLLFASIIINRAKYTKRVFYTMVITAAFLFVNFIISGYAALLKSFLLIVAAKDIRFDNINKYFKNALLIGMGVVITLYIFGISDAGISRRGKIAFGFGHPNVFSYILQTICFCYLCRFKNKLKPIHYYVFLFIGILDLLLVGSRNSGILIIITPIMTNLIAKIAKSKKKRILTNLLYILPSICLLLTYLTTKLYDKSRFVQGLNLLFSARIFLNFYNYSQYGITIFGQRIKYSENLYNVVTGEYSTFNTLDNSYMCLLLQFGIIATVIWIITFYLTYKRLIKDEEYILVGILTSLVIFGLLESSLIEIVISFPLLYLLSKSQTQSLGKTKRLISINR